MIDWYEDNEIINSDKIRYLPNSLKAIGFLEKKLDEKNIVITNDNLNHKKTNSLLKAFAELKKEINNIV